jgi:hypothetical protein
MTIVRPTSFHISHNTYKVERSIDLTYDVINSRELPSGECLAKFSDLDISLLVDISGANHNLVWNGTGGIPS